MTDRSPMHPTPQFGPSPQFLPTPQPAAPSLLPSTHGAQYYSYTPAALAAQHPTVHPQYTHHAAPSPGMTGSISAASPVGGLPHPGAAPVVVPIAGGSMPNFLMSPVAPTQGSVAPGYATPMTLVPPQNQHHQQQQVNMMGASQTSSVSLGVSVACVTQKASPHQAGGSKVFVAGLPLDMDEKGLKFLFSSIGTVIDVRVLYSTRPGRLGTSRGCGFVTFSQPSQAIAAIGHFNGRVLDPDDFSSTSGKPTRGSRKLVVTLADESSEFAAEETTRIFLRHIPQTISKEMLQKVFSSFGAVSLAEIMPDTSSKGKVEQTDMLMGYVTMGTVAEAKAAIAATNGTFLFGYDIHKGNPLIAKSAETMGRRDARRNNAQKAPMMPGYRFGDMGSGNPSGEMLSGAPSGADQRRKVDAYPKSTQEAPEMASPSQYPYPLV